MSVVILKNYICLLITLACFRMKSADYALVLNWKDISNTLKDLENIQADIKVFQGDKCDDNSSSICSMLTEIYFRCDELQMAMKAFREYTTDMLSDVQNYISHRLKQMAKQTEEAKNKFKNSNQNSLSDCSQKAWDWMKKLSDRISRRSNRCFNDRIQEADEIFQSSLHQISKGVTETKKLANSLDECKDKDFSLTDQRSQCFLKVSEIYKEQFVGMPIEITYDVNEASYSSNKMIDRIDQCIYSMNARLEICTMRLVVRMGLCFNA